MLRPCIKVSCMMVAFGFAMTTVQAGDEVFVAATWNDGAVHVLDGDLTDIRSFDAGGSNPNGIATDGKTVWVGHFSSQEIIAYDLNGTEQFRWGGQLSGLQGMDFVDDEILVARSGSIDFFDALNGDFMRSIPSAGGSVEGIAWDGELLWQLETSELIGIDINTGNVVRSIANAANACSFGGTGITASGNEELTLGCSAGQWFTVSSVDGSVIESGNNGLDMFGLKALSGSASCIQKIKRSKGKKGCNTCPAKGDAFKISNSCEKVKDCPKKVKTTIACPNGPGTCKIKAKRSACG